MSDEPKMVLSEIKARTERACEKGQHHYFPAASHALFHDIPYLLDLVSRIGKVLGETFQDVTTDEQNAICGHCILTIESDGRVKHEVDCPAVEARALLEEIKK